jgi:hypothetical protein
MDCVCVCVCVCVRIDKTKNLLTLKQVGINRRNGVNDNISLPIDIR